MQHPAWCWKKGSVIKTEPRILIFRHATWYYNLVWTVDWWSNFCHTMCGGRVHASFTFVVDHSMFWDIARRPGAGRFSTPLINLRRAHRTVLRNRVVGNPRRYPVVCASITLLSPTDNGGNGPTCGLFCSKLQICFCFCNHVGMLHRQI